MPFCRTTQRTKQHRALQKLKIRFDLISRQKYKNMSLPACITLSLICAGLEPGCVLPLAAGLETRCLLAQLLCLSFDRAVAARWMGAKQAVERVINLSRQELVDGAQSSQEPVCLSRVEPVSPLPAAAAALARASAQPLPAAAAPLF